MFRIFKYFRPQEWLMTIISLAFIVFQVWLDLKLPEYMSAITRLTQTPGSDIAEIWQNGAFMLLCALASLFATIIVGFFAAKIGAGLSQRLRSLLFNKVNSFSMEEIKHFSTSSLITRSTNDITQVQMFAVMALQLLIKAPITAVWAISKIAGKGFEWSLVTGVGVFIILIAATILIIFVMPKFKLMQSLTDNITRLTRENLTGIRVVRAYNAEKYQEKKFASANADLTHTTMFTSRAMAIMSPITGLMMSGLTLAIYWVGAYLINAASMPNKVIVFSDMVVFSQYAMQVIMSFMMLIMLFVMFPRASVSAKRVHEVLDTKLSITDGKLKEGKPGLSGDIRFEKVSFRYPDAAEAVLDNISFSAKQGETVAFIGSTGSGKSTLINLIPRFFDVTSGEIFIDGVNVKDYEHQALLNKIGYVPQQAVLFKGTISSNIAYGDNGKDKISTKAVQQALKIAQGANFVQKMHKKHQSAVAQGGSNLSGGQKQRIAIARAVARKPEIYIFDDSFSALDYKTDHALRAALKKESAGVTSLIVAQRIGTILDADQIIVLDNGKIVGHGKHQELLKKCKVYKEIAISQLSEKELKS